MPHGSQTRKLGWNLFRGASGMGRGHRGTSTPQDLLLPEGKLIRTTRGGPNAIKQLLLDLKKYSFSGYVRTVRGGSGKRSEGIVLLRGGNPEASLYHRDGAQDRGRSALKKVWQDSYDESCILELHARVDMDGLVREYADSILERPAKVVKKTKIPQTMERSEVEKQIRAWKDKGYDISSLESNLDAEPSILAASVVAMRDGVKKAEAVGEMLAGLDVSGFESRAAILRERLKDPVRHPDIDTEVESLRDAVESLRQIEARRQVELERGRDSQERTRKVLDLVMKQQQALRPEAGPYSTEDVARKVLEESPPARDAATNLVQTYTFESFIVGESNRFAHGAAVAVAKQLAKEYNPLLITSGPGLGKTHLLHAIGNYVASRIGARRRPRASGPPDAGDHPRASRPRRERRHRGRSADVHREPRGEQRPRARWGLQSGRRVLVVDASPAHPGSRPRSLVRCDRGTDRGTDPATDARADRGRAGRPSAELGDGNPRTYTRPQLPDRGGATRTGVPPLDGFPRWRGRRPGHHPHEPETRAASPRLADGTRPMAHGPRGLCRGDDRPRARANRLRDRGLHGEADPRRHPLGRNRIPGFEQLVRRRVDVRAAAVGCDFREPLRVHHLARARDLEGPRAEDARARDGSHPVSVIVEGLTRDFEPPCEIRGSGGARLPRIPASRGRSRP